MLAAIMEWDLPPLELVVSSGSNQNPRHSRPNRVFFFHKGPALRKVGWSLD